MTYLVESSDSESEDDGEVYNRDDLAEPPIAVSFEDEEEEVEYFGGKGPSSTSSATDKTESKLASILFQKDASTTKTAEPAGIPDGGKGELSKCCIAGAYHSLTTTGNINR